MKMIIFAVAGIAIGGFATVQHAYAAHTNGSTLFQECVAIDEKGHLMRGVGCTQPNMQIYDNPDPIG